MKKNSFLLLTALLLLASISELWGQRYADLSFSILSPANGTIIDNGDSRVLQMQLTNNGPDTFKTTDTMYIFGNLQCLPANAVLRGAVSQSMPPGISAAMQFSGALGTVVNNRMEAADTTMELCISLITGNLMSIPVVTEVLDTIAANNKACVTLTFKGKPTGIADRNGARQSSLKLYPNPARNKVTFDVSLKTDQGIKAIIRDMTGRTIRTNDYGKMKAGPTALVLDVSRLPTGMYSMEVQTGEQVQMGKLVIW